jgi:hypothetical protein
VILKHKRRDAGHLDIPERSHEVFSLSEKGNVLDLIRKSYMYGRNKLIYEIVKKGKEACMSFAAAPHTTCVVVMMRGKSLVIQLTSSDHAGFVSSHIVTRRRMRTLQ